MIPGKKILICGLSGAGKTTLAAALSPLLRAPVFDGDAVRDAYPVKAGFDMNSRAMHARCVGKLCEAVTASGNHAIASIIAPTAACRAAFGPDFLIWMDGGYAWSPVNNDGWEPPSQYHLKCLRNREPEYWADLAADMVRHGSGREALGRL